MSTHFTPRTFVLRAPNALLQEYFARHAPDMDIEWDGLEETDDERILDAWNALPPEVAGKVEHDFRLIFDLADDDGVQVVINQAEFLHKDLREKLEAQDGLTAKALWVFLEEPTVFEQAVTFYEADQLDGRSWSKRKDLPPKEPATSNKAIEELRTALAAYYWQKQGRAKRCDVHYLPRSGGLHYFFAYPEGYTTDILTYQASEKLEKLTVSLASEVVFAFNPEEGSLNLFAKGGVTSRMI